MLALDKASDKSRGARLSTFTQLAGGNDRPSPVSLPATDNPHGTFAELSKNMDGDNDILGMSLDVDPGKSVLDRNGRGVVNERILHRPFSNSLPASLRGLATSGCSSSTGGESTNGYLQFGLNHPISLNFIGEQSERLCIIVGPTHGASVRSLLKGECDAVSLGIGSREGLNDASDRKSGRNVHISPPIPDTLL